MKFTKTLLASAIAFTIAHANANDFTVNAVIKNETAAFTKSGSRTGNYAADTISSGYVTKGSQKSQSSSDVMKSETSARIFINGAAAEGVDLHAELRPVYDTEGVNSDNKGHEADSQRDYLRELYFDTTTADGTFVRFGKQQVVWGKADGAKFLDLINATDYREMAQNAMDESRITTWALNAEKILDDGSTVQVVISQPKENLFAGLNRNTGTAVRANAADYTDSTLNNGNDTGHAFLLLGPDTITGNRYGFLNIVPDLGGVAGRFAGAFGAASALGSTAMSGFTVGMFESMTMNAMGGALAAQGMGDGGSSSAADYWKETPSGFQTAISGVASALSASEGAVTGAQMLAYGFQPFYNTELANVTTAKDTAFDYMDNATFATFDAFGNAKSQYKYNMPDDFDLDIGTKLSRSLNNGMNYSVAYSYNYDKNPIINLSWKGASGEQLYAHRINTSSTRTGTSSASGTTVVLSDSATDIGATWGGSSNSYGGYAAAADDGDTTDATTASEAAAHRATLEFEQTVERVHNIGAAFDYAIDTQSFGPVVLRGEFVYQKDGKQPVINLEQMSVGNITEALKMEDADKFKYVIGADVTVLTDMMVSTQFIQERNLDYVDTAQTCTFYDYSSGSAVASNYSCNKFTTDYASMHLTNGFNQAIKNKEFYSLFLSKPFGDSGEGRWNNILMLEEGGGRWNRFDVEYSLSNDLVGSIELNKYWGSSNSQFGQLENSSNVQVGLKYIIE